MRKTPNVKYNAIDKFNVTDVSASTASSNNIDIKYICSGNSGAEHRYGIIVELDSYDYDS